jgi:predicted small lipoprotein YifL
MKHPYAHPAVLLACLVVTGCGQKGPLFLPGDRSELQTELPPLDRDALEEAFENGADQAGDVPDTERPASEDDAAEPFIDPAKPKPRSEGVPPADQDGD